MDMVPVVVSNPNFSKEALPGTCTSIKTEGTGVYFNFQYAISHIEQTLNFFQKKRYMKENPTFLSKIPSHRGPMHGSDCQQHEQYGPRSDSKFDHPDKTYDFFVRTEKGLGHRKFVTQPKHSGGDPKDSGCRLKLHNKEPESRMWY